MHRMNFAKWIAALAVSALMASFTGCGDAPPGANADDVTLSPDANFGPDIKVIPGGGVVDPVDPSVGDECETDDDCDSGLCVEAADGPVRACSSWRSTMCSPRFATRIVPACKEVSASRDVSYAGAPTAATAVGSPVAAVVS